MLDWPATGRQWPPFRQFVSLLAAHKTDERVFAAFVGAFNEMFGCELSTAEIVAQSQADRVDLFTGWSRVARADIDKPDALELMDAAARLNAGSLDHARFATSVTQVFDRWLTDDRTPSTPPPRFLKSASRTNKYSD